MQRIEKRKLDRFSLEVPAKIEVISAEDSKERLDLVTSNVSSGGAYFKASHPLPVPPADSWGTALGCD